MTTIDAPDDAAELAESRQGTYDLIIVRNDRLVVHDVYTSPAQRLRRCVSILTDSDVLGASVNAERCARIRTIYEQEVARGEMSSDQALNTVAKEARRWGVHVYVSSTAKLIQAPEMLYSVVTEYGPGQVTAEHFPTRRARREGLVERAEQLCTGPGLVPERVLADEQRLASLLNGLLRPAVVTLAEARFDAARGVYRPATTSLLIH